MAKHLTDNDIEAIVEYLDEWDLSKKVTWEKLCSALAPRFQEPVRRPFGYIGT